MAQWFVVRDGKEDGPFSSAQLKEMAAAGKLRPKALVRREDLETPRQASAIKGLFPDIHQKVGQAADAVGRTGETVKKVAENVGKVADAVNEVAGATEKLRQAATSIAGIAGGISAFAGSIGDFLRPLGNINLVMFLLAGGTTPVLVFLARRQTTITQKFKYGAAAVVALAVAVIFGLWTGLAAVASKGDKGVLASNVKPIDRLQEAVVPTRDAPPVAAPKPPAPTPKDAPTLLQGRWYAVSEEVAGKDGSEETVIALDKIADVTGGRMRIERTIGGKRDFYDGTFRLEPSATPKLFDWEGRGPGDGQVEMHGIYELSDDTFKVCYMIVPKGAEYTRPKEYRTTLGSRRVFNTFKRSAITPSKSKPTEARTFSGHSAYVTHVAVSPNGQFIASGSKDRTVRLWDRTTGQQVWKCSAFSTNLFAVAFSPDGNRVWTACRDATKRLDTSTGNVSKEMSFYEPCGQLNVPGVAFGDGCARLAVPGKGAVSLYDTWQQKMIAREKVDVPCLIFGKSTGEVILGGNEGEGEIKLWQVQGRSLKRSFIGLRDRTMALRLSPDGRLLAASSGPSLPRQRPSENKVVVWEVSSGRRLHEFQVSEGWQYALSFSPDSRLLAAGGSGTDDDWFGHKQPDNTVRIWNLETEKEVHRFRGHAGAILSIAFTPDGKSLVSGSADSSLKLWSLD